LALDSLFKSSARKCLEIITKRIAGSANNIRIVLWFINKSWQMVTGKDEREKPLLFNPPGGQWKETDGLNVITWNRMPVVS